MGRATTMNANDSGVKGYFSLTYKPAAFRGGSFTEALFAAFKAADMDNRLRLEAAFPGIGEWVAKRLSE